MGHFVTVPMVLYSCDFGRAPATARSVMEETCVWLEADREVSRRSNPRPLAPSRSPVRDALFRAPTPGGAHPSPFPCVSERRQPSCSCRPTCAQVASCADPGQNLSGRCRAAYSSSARCDARCRVCRTRPDRTSDLDGVWRVLGSVVSAEWH